MAKKAVKVKFVDFWNGFDPADNFIATALSRRYDVVLSEEPDILFFSCFGQNFTKYDCVRVFYTPENLVPDFNVADYAIGFHYIDFGRRYLRYPIYLAYGYGRRLIDVEAFDESKSKRKFCSFVYSNGTWASPLRKQFFDLLSAYKQVDSGGRYMNNVGGPVENKIAFQSEYKFCIAFENSIGEGYTTEKLIEAMMSGSIPIYWGDPSVVKQFNPDSFINVSDYGSLEKVVQEVIRLDHDDEAYLEKLNQPWVRPCDGAYDSLIHFREILSDFLSEIVEHPVKYLVRGNFHRDYHESLYRNNILNKELFDNKCALSGFPPLDRLFGHYYRRLRKKLLS